LRRRVANRIYDAQDLDRCIGVEPDLAGTLLTTPVAARVCAPATRLTVDGGSQPLSDVYSSQPKRERFPTT
jgi:hypothetical protein